MTKFKIDDWVEITPNQDFRWPEWNSGVHSLFCGKIGYIEDIVESMIHPDDREEDYIKVCVYFPDKTFRNPGWYWCNFKSRHLVLSTAAKGMQYVHDSEASEETNNFETFTKQKRDEIFRYMFSDKRESDRDSIEKIKKEEERMFLLKDLSDEEIEQSSSVWDLVDLDPFI
tara:strand:- start:182 stop:694 length:513 start_codon:yes stop_codon:yes gene_type:complete